MSIRHARQAGARPSPPRGGPSIRFVTAAGVALLGAVAAIRRTARSGFARTRRGYNCCERCSTRLPRDPQHTWRYLGTCPRCGHVQQWSVAAQGDEPSV